MSTENANVALKFPLPCQFRPDPYIEDGEFGYMYRHRQGGWRKIKSDHHTGGGSFQFNYLDGAKEMNSCGWNWSQLLSAADMAWMQSIIAKHGKDYAEFVAKAKNGDLEAGYLLSWLEAAHWQNEKARHDEWTIKVTKSKPDYIAVEDLFHALAYINLD